MQYMMIFFEDADVLASRNTPGKAEGYWGAWMAYVHAINGSGIVVGGNGLELPETATTVRIANGERLVQDGPVVATKEQLGGYYVIDVPDLETALAWAARSPAATNGAVEVRPVLPPPANQ